MRHVYENPDEVASKGREARKYMSNFSPEAVADIIAAQVRRIQGSIKSVPI